MQRMVARITGIINGKSTSGSKSSRARALSVSADMSVPNTQNPMVPSKVTRKTCGSKFHKLRLKRIQKSGMTTISTSTIKTREKVALARNSETGSNRESRGGTQQRITRSE